MRRRAGAGKQDLRNPDEGEKSGAPEIQKCEARVPALTIYLRRIIFLTPRYDPAARRYSYTPLGNPDASHSA